MSEVHNMREIENLEALVKSLEQSNERLKQSVVDLLKERIYDAILMDKASDEIERLRADADFNYMHGYESAKSDYRDQLIESEAEIERLRVEIAGDKILEDCETHGPVYAAIAGVWGRRCSDFEEGCPCCRAWAEYDEIERLRAALEGAAVQFANNNLPAFSHQCRAALEGE